MRSVGGAGIGLAAWLFGCARVSDPGEAPEPERVLEWDAGARTIRCGDDVALPILPGLTVYGRESDGRELIVLIVIDIGTTKATIDMSDPNIEAHS